MVCLGQHKFTVCFGKCLYMILLHAPLQGAKGMALVSETAQVDVVPNTCACTTQVLQTLSDDERRDLTAVALREKAREFALKTVDSQRAQFKRYGVWGDWAEPYVTLQPKYEAAQVGVFGEVLCSSSMCRHT